MSLRPARRAAPSSARAASIARQARPAVLAALAGVALAACGDDPFAQEASQDTQASLMIVYPVSQAPPELPVAVDLAALRAVRPGLRAATGGPNFDVALDVDASGQIRVLAQQFVLVPITGVQRVGVQTVTGQAFDDVTLAPTRNFRFDTVTVAAVGQPVIVQTPGLSCSATVPLSAKFVVDSVVGPQRAMFVRVRLNPNCGFRSLAPGRPTE